MIDDQEPTYEDMIKHRMQELAEMIGFNTDQVDIELNITRKVKTEVLQKLERAADTYNWICPDCRSEVDFGRYNCPVCGLELSNL